MYYKRAGSDDLDQAVSEDLTPSQYRAAELGYFGLLRRKGMSRQFIDHNGEDLLQQACFEYTRTIRAGKEIRKPVAWIVLCAWSRTKRVLEQPNWRPRMVSTESVGEISGDATPAPEEELLIEDRYRKVREAVERLPAYQRELLSLSYFEGMSVREAARELDWTPSKAQRAHQAAQRGLHRLLRVETSEELEIAAGLAAFLSFGPDGCARIPQLVGGFEAAVDTLAHLLHHLGERGLDLVRRPFAHGGSDGATPAPGRAEALGDLGRRALAGAHHGPKLLAARAGRRMSDFGRRMFVSGAVETTAAADGGARFAEACKIAAVCVIGTGAIAGGSALLGSGQHHRAASPPNRPVALSHPKAVGAPASESHPTPVVVPTGPQERTPTAAASGSDSRSSNPTSSSTQPSRAQRRAQNHQAEESTAEATFEAGQIAAAEEEEWRSSSGSSASTSTGSTLSDSADATEATTAARAFPKVQAEERQTKTQFQGGLP
jgi:RNA polymerase sigma factor (sigma-70 family)